MNEKTTLEVIAPTVEEALAQGLAQLGLPAEAISMEVLDAGTKGLFGLGGRQVRVRLTVKSEEEATAAAETIPPAPKSDQQPAPVKKTKPAKPAPKAKKAEPKPEPEPSKPAPALASDMEHDQLLDLTEETVSKMLHLMNLEAQVSAHYGEIERDGRQPINVDIRGHDLSILIGRRSETLNAFQYIASLIIGKEMEQWVHLVIDVEGYRNRRERQLRQMARRMADQVAKSGRRQTLEPMGAAERRIIHLELRDHPAVYTESTGEEPHRKVMIIPKDS